MPPSARGGAALPANPVAATLGGSVAPKGSALPQNPLSAFLGATGAPVAPHQGVSSPLTGYATRIAKNNIDPAFVQHLKTLSQADPTFQDRLNAEIKRVSGQIEAKQNSGPLAIAGNVIEGAANPLEWVKGAIEGVPQVGHGVAKAVGGNLAGGAKQAGLGALGVAGVLPFGRAAGVIGDAISAGRTAEEAASHIDEAVARAKAESFGNHVGSKGNPPVVGKGVADPATGGELGRQIREALPHAPAVRKTQKAGFSEERAARFKAAGEEHVKAGGGAAGFAAGARQLEGELGREFFGHLKHLTQGHLDEAAKIIDQAPLQYGEKLHAFRSLKNAIENGVAPTKGDHALLERVFGKVAGATAEGDQITRGDKIFSYLGIPRALRSTGDISASFRQNLAVLVTHPTVWQRNFQKSLKTLVSENAHQDVVSYIHSHPLYPLALKAKVPFTELPARGADGHLDIAEEFYPGTKAEQIPGLGRVVRASDRSFTDQVNLNRLELFAMNIEKAAKAGYDINDQHLLESFGKVAGTFTGRGVVPGLKNHPQEVATVLKALNVALFAPRFMASRINLFSPFYMRSLHPAAQAEVWRARASLLGVVGSVLLTAKALGADVNMDPRSSNFGKVKIGNTRIDIGGGYEQYIRLAAQQLTLMEIASNGSHKKIAHGSASDKPVSEFDFATHFLRGKLGPIPSYAVDWSTGKDFLGRPTKLSTLGGWGHQAFENAPFIAQDAKDSFGLGGSGSTIAKRTAIAAFLSAIGLGVQSYKDKPPKDSGGSGVDGYWGDSGGTSGGDSGQGYWGP